MTREIQTTADILLAPYEQVELAKVRLAKGEHTRYGGGRIIAVKPELKELYLRYRGHEVCIPNVHEWELVEFKPVVLEAEKKLIRREWSE